MAIVALCICLSLAVWISLDESHWSFIKSQITSGHESKTLWNSYKQLESENKDLQEQLIKLERISQVDKQSAVNLQEEMRKLQDKIYQLKGELEFYQGIMDSAREVEGLNVQGLHIVPLSRAHSYRFKLILTQVTKSDKVTEGKVEIMLEGMLDSSPKVLNIKDVIVENSLELDYKFKHFKRLEGNMMLPEMFVPHTVAVRLQPKGKNLSKVERVFDWQAATAN
jgi:hypothetical protein